MYTKTVKTDFSN